MHCNCGAEIGSSKDYCSNFCEQKDSVWYKEDNMWLLMNYSNSDENTVERQFDKLYPNYDYSLESSSHEKDLRKRKRMKSMY